MLRTIKQIHEAISDPIDDLMTYRPIPTRSIGYIDPFLFLNHHGYQIYPPQNKGLPFGPHPHRGMDTVTLILHGDISHLDSAGGESIVNSGGVQWMHAGKGIIHAEVSSEKFKQQGGPLEILQLWVNLPASEKKTSPWYKGLQEKAIPTHSNDEEQITVHIISGTYKGIQGPFVPAVPLSLYTIDLAAEAFLELDIPKEENIFYYVIKGDLEVNGTEIGEKELVEFRNDDRSVCSKAITDSQLLIGHALPLCEPVVSHGPFVMNTEQEIKKAYNDYRQGKFGEWKS